MIAQLLRFGCVGLLAMAVHWSVAVLLVRQGLAPLLANVCGFATAFWISFLGHRFWTFAGSPAAWSASLRRFVLVALLGFGANQLAYWALLDLGGMRYDLALALVLCAVAVSTFLLSRRWAFA